MMPIIAQAWRLRTGNKDEYIYRLQAEEVETKSEQKLYKVMEGWSNSGEAFNLASENKKYLLLFTRCFSSEGEWLKWAKQFPYELKEMSSTSESYKTIKLGIDIPKRRGRPPKNDTIKKAKRGRPRKRICGACGQKGHNRRTCSSAK